MKVTLTGGTGLIGRPLVDRLLEAGHAVHLLGRERPSHLPAGVEFSKWDGRTEPPSGSLADADVVVNLAGEPVAQRWTPEAKKRIRDSRVEGTRMLVNALSTQSRRPEVLVNGSAMGIYGSRGDEVLTEASAAGDGFLANVTREWEQAAVLAESLGIRVVNLRTSVVLSTKGGALAKMMPPFRFGVGGKLGSGKQWMSWIHIEDEVEMILFAVENSKVRGPLNLSTANPVTNAEFTKKLGAALHRPAIVPVPAFAIQMMFGEMAEVVLGSQRVHPKAAERAGYRFRHPTLREALDDLLRRKS